MAVVGAIRVFGHINDGKREGFDVAVLNINSGPFHIIPMVHSSVGIAHEVPGRVISESFELPVGDAVFGNKVIGLAGAPIVDGDVVEAAAIPDHRVLEIAQRRAVSVRFGINTWAHDFVRAEDAILGFADQDLAGARHDFEVAIRAHHDAVVGRAPAGLVRNLNGSELGPGAVEGLGDKYIAGPGLADDDGIGAVRHDQGGYVVTFAGLVIRPEQAFFHVRPIQIVADGLDGNRATPTAVVALGSVPAAGKKMVFAIRPLDNLAVPIIILLDGGVFEAVLRVAWLHAGGAPSILGQVATLDRRGLEVINQGFGSGLCSRNCDGLGIGGGRRDRLAVADGGRDQAKDTESPAAQLGSV